MDITVSKNSFNHALLYSIVFLILKFKVMQLERLRSILNGSDHPCVSSTLELYNFGICSMVDENGCGWIGTAIGQYQIQRIHDVGGMKPTK